MNNVYFHFVNVDFNFINVRNNNNFLFIIFRRYKIDSIMKYEIEKVYFVNLKSYFLFVKFFSNKEFIFAKFTNLLNSKLVLKKITINFILKIKFFNNIIIYEK